jgi:hypothetical protein
MRMKTHVFNYKSDWLQRAGVHWQSAGEQNSIKIHDTISGSVQSSPVTVKDWLYECSEISSLSVFFNWHLREKMRRNSQLIQHRLSVLIRTSLTA